LGRVSKKSNGGIKKVRIVLTSKGYLEDRQRGADRWWGADGGGGKKLEAGNIDGKKMDGEWWGGNSTQGKRQSFSGGMGGPKV